MLSGTGRVGCGRHHGQTGGTAGEGEERVNGEAEGTREKGKCHTYPAYNKF